MDKAYHGSRLPISLGFTRGWQLPGPLVCRKLDLDQCGKLALAAHLGIWG
jgi:hypothetical protein